jgi:hypothetical protein
MIYDLTYFENELFIPNLYADDSDVVSNNDLMLRIMKSSDIVFLKDCFGLNLAKEILDNVETDGTVKPTAPQLIKDIVDGDGDWLGLRFEINGVKKSLIANYAYCQYLSQTERRLTQLGSVQNDAEKGQIKSNWNKYVVAWNEMLFFRQRKKVYHKHWKRFVYEKNDDDVLSLEEYIIQKDGLSIDKFKRYDPVNAFGL